MIAMRDRWQISEIAVATTIAIVCAGAVSIRVAWRQSARADSSAPSPRTDTIVAAAPPPSPSPIPPAPTHPTQVPAVPEVTRPPAGSVPLLHARDSARAEPTAPTLSGRWRVFVQITHTTYSPFLGLTAAYDLTFSHVGDLLTAHGCKVLENGRPIPQHSQDAMEVDGQFAHDRIHATYVLHGSRRDSTGSFEWTVSPDGERFDGTFFGDRSETRGLSWGTRTP